MPATAAAPTTLADVEAFVAARPKRDEWVDLEFKKTTAEKEPAMQTLCGFLNGAGGVLLFGATPDGRLVGQTVSDATLREVEALFPHFEPAAPVELARVPVGNAGNELLVVAVHPVEEDRPYTYRGQPFQRVGSVTRPMPQARYEQLRLERQDARKRWEHRVAEGVGVDDLDATEIRRTLQLGIAAGRVPADDAALSVADALAKLHLLRDRQPTQAAVALFGPALPDAYPQLRLHLAHFNGTTKDADLLDLRPPLHGHAFHLLGEAEAFLRRNLPQAGRLVPGLIARADEPVFPVRVLREVLANALAHRDYSLPGGAVHVAIYTDRVEVTNPGALPPGLAIADLFRPHDSRPRNPTVARVCFTRGLIDEWGRGTGLIVRGCREAGHPDPEFFEAPASFGVRLWSRRPLGPVPAAEYPITARQRAVLGALLVGQQTVAQVADQLGTAGEGASEVTLRRDLRALQRLGLVALRRGRGGGWSLAGDGVRLAREQPPHGESPSTV